MSGKLQSVSLLHRVFMTCVRKLWRRTCLIRRNSIGVFWFRFKYSFFKINCLSSPNRWGAPVSIALHAPGTDFAPTINSIKYLRDCATESALVRQFTTFHIYFSSKHVPKGVSITCGRLVRLLFVAIIYSSINDLLLNRFQNTIKY